MPSKSTPHFVRADAGSSRSTLTTLGRTSGGRADPTSIPTRRDRAGGKLQGLAPGDRLAVLVRGEVIENPQFKTPIELPGKRIASLEVVSSFGTEVTSEGSICKLVEGDLAGHALETLVVESQDQEAKP